MTFYENTQNIKLVIARINNLIPLVLHGTKEKK